LPPELDIPLRNPAREAIEQAMRLRPHGWTVVSDVAVVPIVMARRRLRWFGRRRLIEIGFSRSFAVRNIPHVSVVGVGWVIRDQKDLVGR